MQGLDSLEGLTPIAGGVVEGLSAEEVSIGGVERSITGDAQSVSIDLSCYGVSG